jgi:hypothetical protein
MKTHHILPNIVLASLLISPVFSQSRTCAKQMLASADSLALTYAANSQFVGVSASDVDTTGKAAAWTYTYASFDNAQPRYSQVYYFLAQNGHVAFDHQVALAPGISVMTDRWMDSDSAFQIAQGLGGSKITTTYPSCTIAGSVGQPLAPPFAAEWQINYECSGTVRWVRINATTGEYLNSGNFLTSVENLHPPSIPSKPELFRSFPNPFNPTCTITFALPNNAITSVTIIDISGRQVASLASGYLHAGIHSRRWNASGVASGIYFCRLQAEGFVQTKKLIVLK